MQRLALGDTGPWAGGTGPGGAWDHGLGGLVLEGHGTTD